jgi:hypothetical protein
MIGMLIEQSLITVVASTTTASCSKQNHLKDLEASFQGLFPGIIETSCYFSLQLLVRF